MDGMDVIFDIRVVSYLLGILVPLFIYWYSTKNYNYWKKRGIPFVKPYPFIGSGMDLLSKSLEVVEEERYKKYGRIYGYYEGDQPAISVGDPELLRDILVKDFQFFPTIRIIEFGDTVFDKLLLFLRGEDWKRVRSIISPTFSTGKIKRVMGIFQDCAKTLTQSLKEAAAKGDPVDLFKFYGAFTIDIIASSAFSTKLDSHKDPENEFLKKAKAIMTQKFNLKLILFLLMPSVLKRLQIPIIDPENTSFFKRAILAIIEERKKTGQKRNDFLQLLLDAANEAVKEEKSDDKSEDIVANYGDDSINHSVFKNTSSKHLSMDELVAQCVIFFIAGYHTTATTLALTTYFLSLNQDVQDKLFKEIEEVLSETDGELTYESLQKMKYLDNVISETLRLYPPAIRLDRTAEADYKLGDTGIIIPKGMFLTVPVCGMHKDPKLFPEPERFNPDRFRPEEREKQVPYSYLPFSAGPRNCVGMRFALIEIKVCLIHVLSTFCAKKCPETKIPPEFERTTNVLQLKSITLRMEPRSNSPLKA